MENKDDGNKKFIVTITKKYSSTWQGTILWTERNELQIFRSEIELLKLIDSALEET